MAERIHDLPGVTLVATDFSPRFVELTAARGVDARQADICYLPFDDDTFDVVYAGWMLYHVRDLERALNEVRRVLRPGRHVRRRDQRQRPPRRPAPRGRRPAGGHPASAARPASRCCGAASTTYAVTTSPRGRCSPTTPTAQAYLDSTAEGLVLPPFEGEREYAGAVTVFEAR